MLIARRVLSGALALAGIALLVIGGWFAANLGSDGAATFRATPDANTPLVLEPTLLNRSDRPLTVTLTPAKGDSMWTALGAPSDANAAVGKTPVQRFSSVKVGDWSIVHTASGTGKNAALASADIWIEPTRSAEPVTYTIDQANAPQVVVATGTKAPLASVDVTFTHKAWFYQALTLALVGLLLFLGAAVALLHSFRPIAALSTLGRRATVEETAAVQETRIVETTEPDAIDRSDVISKEADK